MKNVLTLLILTQFTILSYSQTLVNQDWVQTGGSPTAMYDFHASHIDASHNLYVVGNTFHSGQQENFLIQKFNSSGVLQWEKEYNGTLSNTDFATDVTTVGSTIYVTGVEGDTATNKTLITTIALNSSGTIMWISKYTGTYSGYNIPARIIPNASGTYLYVTGTSQTSATDFAMVTLCYNTSGTQQWVARYDSTGLYSGGADLKIVGSNIVSYGVSGLSSSSGDFITNSYNLTTGSSQGYTRVNNKYSYITKAVGMVKDAAENIYFTGVVLSGTNNTDIKIVKLDSLLNVKWTKTIDGGANGNDAVTGIKIDLSGDIVLTGYAAAADTSKSAWTIRMKDSVIVWSKKFYCPIQYKDAKAAGIDLDSLANIYVTGKIYNGTGYNDLTLSYDTIGTLKWYQQYSLGSTYTNSGSNIIVDSGGYVYINGISTTGSTSTYHTIQFSQWRAAVCDSPSVCPTITYAFGNGTITTSGVDSFIEFDIYAKQSVKGTSFYGGNIILTYSDSLFGINIVDSGKITLTRGTITTDTNYVLSAKDTIYKSGILSPNEREVRLSIAPHVASGLFGIADTFQQLCHVKIKFKHSGNFEMQFDQFFMQNQSQYLNGDIYNYNFVSTFGTLRSNVALTYLISDVYALGDTLQFNIVAEASDIVPISDAGVIVTYDPSVFSFIGVLFQSWASATYDPVDSGAPGGQIFTPSYTNGTGYLYMQVSPYNKTTYYPYDDNVHKFQTSSIGYETYTTVLLRITSCTTTNLQLATTYSSSTATNDYWVNSPTYAPYTVTANDVQSETVTCPSCCLGISSISDLTNWSVYPNPFDNNLSVILNLSEYSNVTISFEDILGKTIITKTLGYLSAGRVEQVLDMPSGLSNGLYFVTLNLNGKKQSIKILKD